MLEAGFLTVVVAKALARPCELSECDGNEAELPLMTRHSNNGRGDDS